LPHAIPPEAAGFHFVRLSVQAPKILSLFPCFGAIQTPFDAPLEALGIDRNLEKVLGKTQVLEVVHQPPFDHVQKAALMSNCVDRSAAPLVEERTKAFGENLRGHRK
jgi:hypothetical protein